MQKLPSRIPLLLATSLSLCGCATSETGGALSTAALSGAGGIIGYKVSNGNPAATAVGAAAGYAVAQVANSQAKKAMNEAEKAGYDRAMNQAVKQQYWIMQNRQKDGAVVAPHDPKLIPIQIPESTINGVVVQPHVEYVRVES